ncbi:MAG: 4Fe-4S binding protein [Dehalococcoidia bacterium]|nr:4Fe-4S binding protein [Dehalococcoidia bacterium]
MSKEGAPVRVHSERLKTGLAGLQLRSPCLIASSFLTGDIRRIRRADQAGAGGVSTKMALLQVLYDFRADIVVHKKGMWIIAPGDKRISIQDDCRLVARAKEETRLVVIANLLGPAADLEWWQELARQLQDAGADALELDLSCPNLSGELCGILGAPPGASVAQYPELSLAVTRAVREVAKIPIICKLTASVSNIGLIAKACHEAGADAITAINGVPAVPPIDIYGNGRPMYIGLDRHNLGGMCGPAIFPIACRAVADISRNVPIPVIGCGGISTWQEAVQMIMWGASALEICTAVILKGFRVIEQINEGLDKYMEHQGYNSIQDFRGVALQHISTPDQLQFRDIRISVDMDRCNLCGLCLNLGQCLALSAVDGKVVVDNDQCIMCGVCVQVCPRKALTAWEKTSGAALRHGY